MTIKKKLAVVGAFFSRDNADEGAFSGPVRSGDTSNLAWPDIEVETG
jgi:hypothetical protein